eukprot:GHVT01086143.1.p2 GENE.GHVT01086143.1~~GHVT01086143.1.p2  ORF type:complete len:184 (-),score=25.83 GHVT01086143.1:2279-2830(-)
MGNLAEFSAYWVSTGHFEKAPELEKVREYCDAWKRYRELKRQYGADYSRAEEVRVKIDRLEAQGVRWQPKLVDMWQVANSYKLFLGRNILQTTDFSTCLEWLNIASGDDAEKREEGLDMFLKEFSKYVSAKFNAHRASVLGRKPKNKSGSSQPAANVQTDATNMGTPNNTTAVSIESLDESAE